MFRNPTSVPCDCELSSNDKTLGQHVCQKRECRQPHTRCACERCQGSCHDAGCKTRQRRSDSSSRLVNCHHDTSSQEECERSSICLLSKMHTRNILNMDINIEFLYTYKLHRRNIRSSEGKEDLTRPLLGHKDWEEKRHQLLLQKMQLETERERLQARLAEQEEKLHRQTEQLRQSQLDYSRQNTNQRETTRMQGHL